MTPTTPLDEQRMKAANSIAKLVDARRLKSYQALSQALEKAIRELNFELAYATTDTISVQDWALRCLSVAQERLELRVRKYNERQQEQTIELTNKQIRTLIEDGQTRTEHITIFRTPSVLDETPEVQLKN